MDSKSAGAWPGGTNSTSRSSATKNPLGKREHLVPWARPWLVGAKAGNRNKKGIVWRSVSSAALIQCPSELLGAAAKELYLGSSPHCDSPAHCPTDGAQRLCNMEKSSSAGVHGLGWARTMQGGGSGAKKCSAGMQGVLLLRGREGERNT